MKNIFTEHPHQVGESYLEHAWSAVIFGLKMILGGLACLVHAVFPFLFKKTASNYLLNMMIDFVNRTPKGETRLLTLAKAIEKNATQ